MNEALTSDERLRQLLTIGSNEANYIKVDNGGLVRQDLGGGEEPRAGGGGRCTSGRFLGSSKTSFRNRTSNKDFLILLRQR